MGRPEAQHPPTLTSCLSGDLGAPIMTTSRALPCASTIPVAGLTCNVWQQGEQSRAAALPGLGLAASSQRQMAAAPCREILIFSLPTPKLTEYFRGAVVFTLKAIRSSVGFCRRDRRRGRGASGSERRHQGASGSAAPVAAALHSLCGVQHCFATSWAHCGIAPTRLQCDSGARLPAQLKLENELVRDDLQMLRHTGRADLSEGPLESEAEIQALWRPALSALEQSSQLRMPISRKYRPSEMVSGRLEAAAVLHLLRHRHIPRLQSCACAFQDWPCTYSSIPLDSGALQARSMASMICKTHARL